MNRGDYKERVITQLRKKYKKLAVMPLTYHRLQRQLRDSNARHQLAPAGRRFGKTTYGAHESIIRGWKAEPGKEVLVVAPTAPLVEVSFRKYLELIPSACLHSFRESSGRQQIILANGTNADTRSSVKTLDGKPYNGVQINFRGASGAGIIGVAPVGVHIDEAGLMEDKTWVQELRPALMDNRAWTIWTGTPRRRRSKYYENFVRGKQDAEEFDHYFSVQAPSFANPYLMRNFKTGELEFGELLDTCRDIDPNIDLDLLIEIYEMYDRGEDIYKGSTLDGFARMVQQEIFAVFLSEGGAVFPGLDAVLNTRLSKGISSTEKFFIGLDFGSANDYTVAVAIRQDGKMYPEVLRIRKNSYGEIAKAVVEFATRFNNPIVWLDSTGVGQAAKDILAREAQGIKIQLKPVNFSENAPLEQQKGRKRRVKEWIIEELTLAIETKQIEIASNNANNWLLDELSSIEMKLTPSGVKKFAAPQGIHDDGVVALALANVARRYGNVTNQRIFSMSI